MKTKNEILDNLEKLYYLGKEKLEYIRDKSERISNHFPDDADRIAYMCDKSFLGGKSPLNDPDFRQVLATSTASNAVPEFEKCLQDLQETWFEPVMAELRKTGIRNFLFRFEEGETRKTDTVFLDLRRYPRDFQRIRDTILAYSRKLSALREIIEDFESTSWKDAIERNNNLVSNEDEIVAEFSFTQNYALCVNGHVFHKFQIGNDVAGDFRGAFNNNGKPVKCKSKNGSLKTTINKFKLPAEIRPLFARQNKGLLIVNKTIRRGDLVEDFVEEERIDEIIKELSNDNSSKE